MMGTEINRATQAAAQWAKSLREFHGIPESATLVIEDDTLLRLRAHVIDLQRIPLRNNDDDGPFLTLSWVDET